MASRCLPFLFLGTTPLHAQNRDGGVLPPVQGVVTDSSGRPIPYALVRVLGTDFSLFTTPSGRFTLSPDGADSVTLRISQIGYLPVEMRLSARVPGREPVRVTLAVAGYRIEDLTVAGNPGRCPAGVPSGDRVRGTASGFEVLFQNAERIEVLERDYPFVSTFHHQTTHIAPDGRRFPAEEEVALPSEGRRFYRGGRVVEVPRRGARIATVHYFSLADLASDRFLRAHCFWMAGASTGGVRQVHFAPLNEQRADWAGTLLLDQRGMVRESEAWLVNLSDRDRLLGARCSLIYREVVPSLVHEADVDCTIEDPRSGWERIEERYRFLELQFLDRRPGDLPDRTDRS